MTDDRTACMYVLSRAARARGNGFAFGTLAYFYPRGIRR